MGCLPLLFIGEGQPRIRGLAINQFIQRRISRFADRPLDMVFFNTRVVTASCTFEQCGCKQRHALFDAVVYVMKFEVRWNVHDDHSTTILMFNPLESDLCFFREIDPHSIRATDGGMIVDGAWHATQRNLSVH
jgi:hypothetical protein